MSMGFLLHRWLRRKVHCILLVTVYKICITVYFLASPDASDNIYYYSLLIMFTDKNV